MAQENVEHKNGPSKAVSFSSLKPQLVVPVQKADEAVQFYKATFGAEELKRTTHSKRKADQELPLLLCAELKIGSSSLLVYNITGNSSLVVKEGYKGVVFCLETEEVDGAVSKALKARAVLDDEIMEEEGACGCGLVGKVKDPFGVVWAIASAGKRALPWRLSSRRVGPCSLNGSLTWL